MPVLDVLKPNKPLAEFVRENVEQDVAVGAMLTGQVDASTVFYLRRPVTPLERPSETARFLAEHERGCVILWDHFIPSVEALVGRSVNVLASAHDASVVTVSLPLTRELSESTSTEGPS